VPVPSIDPGVSQRLQFGGGGMMMFGGINAH